MDASARKLMAKYSLSPGVAEALVKAGYDSPGAIRRASDAELEAVPGVGKGTRKLIRERVG